MTQIAKKLLERFLDLVINGAALSEAERDLTGARNSETARREIAAGKRVEARTPWLMTLSGKGGYVPGEAFERHRPYRNVTLLDHLVSVARGAAVLAEIDLTAAGVSGAELKCRVARAMVDGFTHDADKILGTPRTPPTESDIRDLMVRYRLDEFLREAGADLTPAALLQRIRAVEVTQADRIEIGQRILTREERRDCGYARIADRLDGAFLDTRVPLNRIPALLAEHDGFRTDAARTGWRAVTLRAPHTPFLLDQLQAGVSAAETSLTGSPPLIEAHHDGELLLVLREDTAEEVMRRGVARVLSRLRSGIRAETNSRGARDLVGAPGELEELIDWLADPMSGNAVSQALYLKIGTLRDPETVDRFDRDFGAIGLPPQIGRLKGFAQSHFQPWAGMRDKAEFPTLCRAAALAVLLAHTDAKKKPLRDRIPDMDVRERELLGLLEAHEVSPPDWVREEAERLSRQTLLAVWAIAHADKNGDLYRALLGPDGLAELWLLGDGERSGLVDLIIDPTREQIDAVRAWVDAAVTRRFISADESLPSRCHFTNLPLGLDAALRKGKAIDQVKNAAFSGREGRPASHLSSTAQTLVSPVMFAEYGLRAQDPAGLGKGVPMTVSSPTSTGLFAALSFEADAADEPVRLNQYDAVRESLKERKPVIVDTQRYGRRTLFARSTELEPRAADQIKLIRMMMSSALRLGRPVHVFQGLARPVPDFVYFDTLPTAVRQAFGGNGLRLEQVRDLLPLLETAERLAERAVSNIGVDLALRLLAPKTRLGAACEAVLIIDRLPAEDRKNSLGIRIGLMSHIDKELRMENKQNDAVRAFARAMCRVQAAPQGGDSNAVRGLGLRLALEAAEWCVRTRLAGPEEMTAAIAGKFEEEFERSNRLKHRGDFRKMSFPRRAAYEAAEVFVTRVWPEVFRSRMPVSGERRTVMAIYQILFERASYDKSTFAKNEDDPEPVLID
jgi:hypothetical protein